MMAGNACDASPVIFTEFNWIAHCGGTKRHWYSATDLVIPKVSLIYSQCVEPSWLLGGLLWKENPPIFKIPWKLMLCCLQTVGLLHYGFSSAAILPLCQSTEVSGKYTQGLPGGGGETFILRCTAVLSWEIMSLQKSQWVEIKNRILDMMIIWAIS